MESNDILKYEIYFAYNINKNLICNFEDFVKHNIFQESLNDDGNFIDFVNEYVYNGVITNIQSNIHYSWIRNYEVETRAIECGATGENYWVLFNRVYGGGKHSNPQAYLYYNETRFVEVEKEETIVIRHFKLKD